MQIQTRIMWQGTVNDVIKNRRPWQINSNHDEPHYPHDLHDSISITAYIKEDDMN